MCVLGLGIDVPDEGARRPLRANERILAANEVDVAGPQQPVVVVLREERDRMERQRTARERSAGMRNVAFGPLGELRHSHAVRHDARYRGVPGGATS